MECCCAEGTDRRVRGSCRAAEPLGNTTVPSLPGSQQRLGDHHVPRGSLQKGEKGGKKGTGQCFDSHCMSTERESEAIYH